MKASYSIRLFITCLLLLFPPAFAVASSAAIAERVEVIGQQPSYKKALSQVLPQSSLIDTSSHSVDSVATLISQAPEVNLNGQGGLLQSVNVRGFARWRIQTLVEGIPIYTERRAGTAAEFLSPDFIGQVYLTAGAASTQLGSGAIGGGLDMRLDVPTQNQMKLSFASNQQYRSVAIKGKQATKKSNWSWMVNHRLANKGEDAAGTQLIDQFEQHSVVLRRQHQGLIQDALVLYSTSNNIGKASADNPQDRLTLYPQNDHLLAKAVFDWHNLSVYLHNSQLDTDISRPSRRTNQLRNEATDIGVQMHNDFSFDQWHVHWRFGLDGRTGVKAYEREIDNSSALVFDRLNLNAERWETGLSTDVTRPLSISSFIGTFIGGARLAYHSQTDNLLNQTQKDTETSAFIGLKLPLQSRFSASFYASSAYRVPSLTERFFNGSTPRGEVRGDANLQTEQAVNLQSSFQYESQNASVTLNLFHQSINNYIERLQLTPELRQYRNLDSADIYGASYQANWQTHWQTIDLEFKLHGQWLVGQDQQGNPVADISPSQHRAVAKGYYGETSGFVALTHRQSSDEIVAGELPTANVTTFDAGINHSVNNALTVSLNLSNITNKAYATSRDDLAPAARGRDFSLSVVYRY